MKKRFFIIFLVTSIVFISSCKNQALKSPICHDVVAAICDGEISLPAGKIYYMGAAEGEDGYISENMLSAVFGGGKTLEIFKLWDDIALFLPSSDHPCEIIAIHCTSVRDTSDTALLLSSRISDVSNSKASKHPEYFDSCGVYVIKNYVFMIISSDTENAVSIAKQTLKKG